MTIGDVLAVVMGVIGFGISFWGMLMASALVFAARAEQGKTLLETGPVRTLITGAVMAGTAGVFGIALLNQSNGLLKLIGWGLLLGLLALGALGGGGVALLVSDRIRGLDPRISPFVSLARGTGVLVLAGLVPVLGWFFITPLAFTLSFGVGWRSLRRPKVEPPALLTTQDLETVG